MELISREDAMRLVESGKLLSGSFGERAKDIIKAIPAIEERKEGRWEHPHNDSVQCSICGYLTNWIEDTDMHGMGLAVYDEKYANFCPNCGSRMQK